MHQFIWLTLAVALQITGGLLHGAPINPDIDLTAKKIIGVFLTFLFFTICVGAWGNVWRLALRLSGPPALLSAALGSAAAAFVAMLLGYAGFLGFRYQWLMNLCLLSGVFVSCLGQAKGWLSEQVAVPGAQDAASRPTVSEISVWLVCSAILVSLLALGAFPLGGGEDVRYHLVGPRLWSDAGRIYMTASLPPAMQSSYWEYLFLWGNGLVTGPGVSGLIEGQLFAQWLHALWGLGGTGLALFYLLAPLVRDRVWVAVAVAVAFCAPSLLVYARVAQNDWGVVFWQVSATALLLNHGTVGASGFLVGVAVGAKPASAMLYALTLAFVWMFAGRKNLREVWVFVLAALAGFLPQALHAWIHTGNPTYPALNGLFKSSWLSPTLETSLSQSAGWLARLKTLWFEVPTVSALLAIPLWQRSRNTALKLIAVSLISSLQLAGTGLIVLAGVSVVTLEYLCERLSALPRKIITGFLSLAILAVTLLQAKVPWGIWIDALNDRLPTSTVMIRSLHLGGYAKSRVRMAVDRDEVIFTSGDNQLYYLSQFNVVVVPEHPELDRRTAQVRDPLDLVRILREFGGDYLIHTQYWEDSHRGEFAKRFSKIMFRYPEAMRVTTRSSAVVDLRALENAAHQACVYTKPHPLARVMLGVPESRPEPSWRRR